MPGCIYCCSWKLESWRLAYAEEEEEGEEDEEYDEEDPASLCLLLRCMLQNQESASYRRPHPVASV